jgi:hypothetical protein
VNSANENLVPLCITEDEVHEALIVAALEEAEIEFVVQGYHDEAFDGLFENTQGHSRILVLEEDEVVARELVSHIPNPKNEEGDVAV